VREALRASGFSFNTRLILLVAIGLAIGAMRLEKTQLTHRKRFSPVDGIASLLSRPLNGSAGPWYDR
jgi:hypothetical protein